MCFSTGAGFGAIIAAVSIGYGYNWVSFIITSVVPAGLVLLCLFVGDESEEK